MDLFEIDNVNSNEFHDSVRSRMKLHVPKIIKQFHANLSLNESESERKKYIEKNVLKHITKKIECLF